MGEVPEDWKGAGQCWFAESEDNDLGNKRFVKLLPVFCKGRELQSAFKNHEADLFRMNGTEN